MKNVKYIIFRYLTNTDYFNIYKPSGTEQGGGGQAYIDFPTASVSSNTWDEFFKNVPSLVKTGGSSGPRWQFPINSIGLNTCQNLTIYQRRPQSIAVAAQKITSSRSNRVLAWHPKHGFPQPTNPTIRKAPTGLAIYFIKAYDNSIWAGWFQNTLPLGDVSISSSLNDLLGNPKKTEGLSTCLKFNKNILIFDENSIALTFYPGTGISKVSTSIKKPKTKKRRITKKVFSSISSRPKQVRRIKSEQDILNELFEDDKSINAEKSSTKKKSVQLIKLRNTKAVKNLKLLYKGKCQITGSRLTFIKKDGTSYSEAHHLIPLGEKGADSPYNIVIISPLIHRMLHYADVSEIDLTKIRNDNTLPIFINKKKFIITWHPSHAAMIKNRPTKN